MRYMSMIRMGPNIRLVKRILQENTPQDFAHPN